MPKPNLKEPYNKMVNELMGDMVTGLHVYRPDLTYPESHSDLQALAEFIIRKYDLKKKPLMMFRSEIIDQENP